MGGRALGVVFSEQEFDSVTTVNLTVTGAQTLSGNVEIGSAATDLIGFYGAAPVDQPTAVTAVTTTGATSTTNAFGYTTSTQANALVTAVNGIISRLKEVGLFA